MQRRLSYKTPSAGFKNIYRELLEQYRDLPCLWDQAHELYNTRAVRQRAYDRLLKTYRRVEPAARLSDLKKKLDNMRACYKRERVKVLKARMKGEEHVPVLWYYNMYTFLDKGAASSQRTITGDFQEERDVEKERSELEERVEKEEIGDEVEYEEVDYLNIEEYNPLSNKKKSIIHLVDGEDIHDESETYKEGDDSQNTLSNTDPLMESYGKTVGLQLNELQPLQRFIAEKLISDVIFHGRLKELKRGTRLNIPNDVE